MKLAVVTVTFNSEPVIERFLECCADQSYHDYVLIVVDNHSADNTLSKCVAFENRLNLEIVPVPSNAGVAKGNNIGIERGLEKSCEHVLLINNDVEFSPTLFESLINEIEHHKEVSAVAPRVNFFEPDGMIWYGGGKFTYWSGPLGKHLGYKDIQSHRAAELPTYVTYAPTCALLVRSDVFTEVGMMDEKYFVYWDDTDFCYRLMKRNKRILYQPSIFLLHKVSFLTGGQESDFSIRLFTRNQIYFIRKHFKIWTRIYFYGMIQTKYLVRLLLGKETMKSYKLRQVSIKDGLKMSI